MATMATVVAVRCRFVIQKTGAIIVALIVFMVMAVCRRGIEMPVQCVLRRPGSLERHEPHQKNQEYTTHGV